MARSGLAVNLVGQYRRKDRKEACTLCFCLLFLRVGVSASTRFGTFSGIIIILYYSVLNNVIFKDKLLWLLERLGSPVFHILQPWMLNLCFSFWSIFYTCVCVCVLFSQCLAFFASRLYIPWEEKPCLYCTWIFPPVSVPNRLSMTEQIFSRYLLY